MLHLRRNATFLIAALVLVASFAGLTAARAQDMTDMPNNSITVTGTGTASGEPDIAYIDLGVQNSSASLAEAFNQTSEAVAAVRGALTELGIALEDIQTTSLNIYPQDTFDPQSGMPTGERTYQVSNTMRVTVRDLTQIEQVVTTAVNAGANLFNGLSFGIEDTAALEQQARVAAVENARERANQLGEALGVTVGNPVMVSEVQFGFPPPIPFGRAEMAMGGAMDVAQSMPISTGQLTVTVSVNVSFAITQ
jgi:uncharacterized protein YggE